jgi:putative GTP pyrophosphokinase
MTNYNLPDKATVPFILTALNIKEEALRAQGIAPETLVAIYNDFVHRKQDLTNVAAQIIATFQQVEEVHMLKYRVKDPIHLIRKVIRKKAEYPDRSMDEHNYMDWLNDLVGVRVMHLYKESWQITGRFIEKTWDLKRPPIAYVHAEEGESTVQQFAKAGFTIKPHTYGYRALHYVIRTQPYKQRYHIEIQLRTLFEEGWSEIDHAIRYPDHHCSAIVRDLITILNRFTGQADSVASFIKIMLGYIRARKPLTVENYKYLNPHIETLPISEKEKRMLHAHLERILQNDK